MVSSYIAGAMSFFPKRSRSISWSNYKPGHGVGLTAQSGTAQQFRIGRENTQDIGRHRRERRPAECTVRQLANLGLGQENKHRKYLRLMKTMGRLLLFKEVFLGHRNSCLLQSERDPSPLQTCGETFIDFSWDRISFQVVLVFPCI